ncbi:MAG: LysM peptidoglycan-binding domain-containing protein [Clostridiaceae bacterium]|nr:LysM peptidoglycan-binding domain-containing protein [Clostridiaceae bacterium]
MKATKEGVLFMDLFRSYQLIDNGEDGYDIILYMDTKMNDVEFAEEFGRIDPENKKRLNQNIMDYIRSKFPNIKINTVKIMAGSILLSSFFLGAPIETRAAEPAASSIATTQSAYNYNIKISVNGTLHNFKDRPFIYNNTTYVPIYEFGKIIGASVWWNSTSKTLGINKNDTMIAFVQGSSKARVNGVETTMPPSIVINDITYAPVRFIAENLGYKVSMDSTTQTVNITKPSIATPGVYKVVAGDTLWKISKTFGTTVDALKKANKLTSDTIYPGQTLEIPVPVTNTTSTPAPSVYKVVAGDTLWKISKIFGITVDDLKKANKLTSDTIYPGQTLEIPVPVTNMPSTPVLDTDQTPYGNTQWPDVTYIVQPGDTATSVAKKFGVKVEDILKYNYMDPDDWLEAGEKIAISGYAPRVKTVEAFKETTPARKGALVDWQLEGKYIIERGDVFTIVDVDTGKQFKVKMLGGYNHADVEPLTAADTTVMKSIFGTWQWSPRAVVIFHNGMNIAASLSGMPHGVDTIENGVNGHFDLYLKNSTSHSSSTSTVYIQQHQNMVLKAAGK